MTFCALVATTIFGASVEPTWRLPELWTKDLEAQLAHRRAETEAETNTESETNLEHTSDNLEQDSNTPQTTLSYPISPENCLAPTLSASTCCSFCESTPATASLKACLSGQKNIKKDSLFFACPYKFNGQNWVYPQRQNQPASKDFYLCLPLARAEVT